MTATFSSVEALRAGLVWTELPANANFARNGDPMLAPMDITAVVQLGKALDQHRAAASKASAGRKPSRVIDMPSLIRAQGYDNFSRAATPSLQMLEKLQWFMKSLLHFNGIPSMGRLWHWHWNWHGVPMNGFRSSASLASFAPTPPCQNSF